MWIPEAEVVLLEGLNSADDSQFVRRRLELVICHLP